MKEIISAIIIVGNCVKDSYLVVCESAIMILLTHQKVVYIGKPINLVPYYHYYESNFSNNIMLKSFHHTVARSKDNTHTEVLFLFGLCIC